MPENDWNVCQILAGEIPSTKVYEDATTYAFRDVKPQAPTHILIIPKEHLESLNDASQSDEALLGHLLRLAPKIANSEGIAETGTGPLSIRVGERPVGVASSCSPARGTIARLAAGLIDFLLQRRSARRSSQLVRGPRN